jgi:glycosyltransferase involved in cell wall biosynthesis
VRIGVVPILDRSWGGIYQYSVTLLEAIADLGLPDEIVVFVGEGETLPESVVARGFTVVRLVPEQHGGRLRKALLSAAPPALVRGLSDRIYRRRHTETGGFAGTDAQDHWRRYFAAHDLDLLIFGAHDERSFRSGIPYIVAIHDLQHRLRPDLPEFAAEGGWHRREYRVRNSIAHALTVLVDSEVGKEDVRELYADTGIMPSSVSVLPFVPAPAIQGEVTQEMRERVRARYGLPDRFLFYPAQFWPHKNHERLVQALGLLAGEGLRTPLMLVGSKTGALRRRTFRAVMAAARRAGVSDLVRYLGYVADDAMPVLYADAVALVMPTFFGPTNIPVLEAWSHDCPVITSDLRGIREQVGPAGVLVDPESPSAIAEGIRSVLKDPGLRDRLARAGRARLGAFTRAEFTTRVGAVIQDARRRLETVQDGPRRMHGGAAE